MQSFENNTDKKNQTALKSPTGLPSLEQRISKIFTMQHKYLCDEIIFKILILKILKEKNSMQPNVKSVPFSEEN